MIFIFSEPTPPSLHTHTHTRAPARTHTHTLPPSFLPPPTHLACALPISFLPACLNKRVRPFFVLVCTFWMCRKLCEKFSVEETRILTYCSIPIYVRKINTYIYRAPCFPLRTPLRAYCRWPRSIFMYRLVAISLFFSPVHTYMRHPLFFYLICAQISLRLQ